MTGDQERQKRKLLSDIEERLPELEEADFLEREMRRKRKLEKITDELMQELDSDPDPAKRIATDPELRAKAAAAVREAARRTTDMRHYDVQMVGGLEMASKPKVPNIIGLPEEMKGAVVEMRTGEGKTLTATIPLYLTSLLDEGSWLITVNDYLARRDAEWMGPVFSQLGRSVSVLAPKNEKGLHPSYIYETDEDYLTLTESLRSILEDEENWERLGNDGLHRGRFSKKGAQALVDAGILPEEHKIDLDRIQYIDFHLTMQHFDFSIDPRKKESIVKSHLPFIDILEEGKHFLIDPKLKRATLTDEGMRFLAENDLLNLPDDGEAHPLWHSAARVAWGIAEGMLYEDMPHLRLATKKEAYAADITYGPSHEFVFDWMADNLSKSLDLQVQRQNLPGFILLDEVDYILIDDARTPHIITNRVDSPYAFYDEIVPHVQDFTKYEFDIGELTEQIEHSKNMRHFIAEELLPLRHAARSDEDVRTSLRQTLQELGEEKQAETFRRTFAQFMEGTHYEEAKGKFRITDEGYALLHENHIIDHPFNIDDMLENKDPGNLGWLHNYLQPNALAKHHVDQHYHFIYNPKTKELWLTDLGERTLTERGAFPAVEDVRRCEEVDLVFTEKLLPALHEEKEEKLWSILDRVDDSVAEVFREFVEGYHYVRKRDPDSRGWEFEINPEGYDLLHSRDIIPHPSPDANLVNRRQGAMNILRAMHEKRPLEDYVVMDTGKGPEVVLIDANSGRPMHGRRLQDGMHEALEAICGLPVDKAGAEVAKISQQMFYEMMPWVAGMSGTAETSWKEFKEVYKLDVSVLPTDIQWRWLMGDLEKQVESVVVEELGNEVEKVTYTDPETGEQFFERMDLPHMLVGRFTRAELEDYPDLVEDFADYKRIINSSRKKKWKNLPDELKFSPEQFAHYVHVLDNALEKISQGRPVLVHTVDPNVSEEIGELLEHEEQKQGIDLTVNVLYHENLDQEGRIIKEGGLPNVITIATNMAGRGVDIKLTEETREAGGLHIIEAQAQRNARNSNQVKGRAARQGDPGSSIPILSFHDPYMLPIGGEKLADKVEKSDEGAWMSHDLITRVLNNVQKDLEERDADAREHTLDYDKVLDQQRTDFLKQRQEVLEMDAGEAREQVMGLYSEYLNDIIERFAAGKKKDLRGLAFLYQLTGAPFPEDISSVVEEPKKKQRVKQSYLEQLDNHLQQDRITEEERKRIIGELDEKLDKGEMPAYFTLIRKQPKLVRIDIDPREVMKKRKEMDGEEFVSYLKQTYSARIKQEVAKKAITAETAVKAIDDITALIDDAVDEGKRVQMPSAIKTAVEVPFAVAYSQEAALEEYLKGKEAPEIYDILHKQVESGYQARGTPEEQLGHSKSMLLSIMDSAWMSHLGELESLHIQIRHPRMDPLVQYSLGAFNLYEWMMDGIERNFATQYFRNVPPKREDR